MPLIPRAILTAIEEVAEAAYPRECCGLLVGRRNGPDVEITRHVESANVSDGDTRDSFEVDPKVRFDLMRELDGDPELDIVGHYHSHPDHPAAPSERDRAMAFEPDLIWIIIAVAAGQASQTRAFRLNGETRTFAEIPIRLDDTGFA